MMLPILRVSDTVATIEVDVMPFLGRTSEGGPHAAAFRWLSRLGADFVRFAPWFPNPRVVVAELEPPDCSRNRTHWNTTLLDQIYADFASAVGSHSVAMQLSTLPSWLFTDGLPLNRTPADPWQPDLDYGTTGGKLRDPTCGEAARYVARLVGWYTAGGFMDECGAWHGSGYRYEWALLSVLNEVQHEHFYQGAGRPAAEAYTVCYDAIRREGLKVNPALRFGAPPRPPRARGGAAGRAPLRSSAPMPLRPTPASPPPPPAAIGSRTGAGPCQLGGRGRHRLPPLLPRPPQPRRQHATRLRLLPLSRRRPVPRPRHGRGARARARPPAPHPPAQHPPAPRVHTLRMRGLAPSPPQTPAADPSTPTAAAEQEEAPTVFEQFDCWLDGDAADADALRRRLAPRARLLANEMCTSPRAHRTPRRRRR